MHLIKNDIIKNGMTYYVNFCRFLNVPLGKLFDEAWVKSRIPPDQLPHYADAIDFYSTVYIARKAQTFLFKVEQIIDFMGVIDRHLAPGHYQVPYDHMIFQFTSPVPESLFLTGALTDPEKPTLAEKNDAVMGIVVGFPPEGSTAINFTAYFRSSAVNRSKIDLHGDGSISYVPIFGTSTPNGALDKQRIANLAMWCIAYMNSPRIIVEKIVTPANVNAKRERQGKQKLEDYFITKVDHAKVKYAPHDPTRIGARHGIRYDVRGHDRTLPTGRVIWIPKHQRGLENERYVPKVYEVE